MDLYGKFDHMVTFSSNTQVTTCSMTSTNQVTHHFNFARLQHLIIHLF
eukprot:UN34077